MAINWKGTRRLAVAVVNGALAVAELLVQFPSSLIAKWLELEEQTPGIAHERLRTLLITVFLIVAVLFAIWPVIRRQIIVDNSYSDKYWDIVSRHDSLGEIRTILWDELKDAYSIWRDNYTSIGQVPALLETLISNAEFPRDLPLPDKGSLVEYGRAVPRLWSGASKDLWDFVSAVYPWSEETDAHPPAIRIMDQESFDKFHDARMKLSNHWHDVAILVLKAEKIAEENIFERYFPYHSKLLKLLTYLECSLALRLHQSAGVGKNWMFELYKRAEKRGVTESA